MPFYEVYFTTIASTTAEVEASTPEEAEDLAYDLIPTQLCANCSGAFGNDPGVDLGDWEVDSIDEIEVDEDYE